MREFRVVLRKLKTLTGILAIDDAATPPPEKQPARKHAKMNSKLRSLSGAASIEERDIDKSEPFAPTSRTKLSFCDTCHPQYFGSSTGLHLENATVAGMAYEQREFGGQGGGAGGGGSFEGGGYVRGRGRRKFLG